MLREEKLTSDYNISVVSLKIMFIAWLLEFFGSMLAIATQPTLLGSYYTHYPDAILMFIIIPNVHLTDSSKIKRIVAQEGWQEGFMHIIGKRNQVHPGADGNIPNDNADPAPSNNPNRRNRDRHSQPETQTHSQPNSGEGEHGEEVAEDISSPEQFGQHGGVHRIQVHPAPVRYVKALDQVILPDPLGGTATPQTGPHNRSGQQPAEHGGNVPLPKRAENQGRIHTTQVHSAQVHNDMSAEEPQQVQPLEMQPAPLSEDANASGSSVIAKRFSPEISETAGKISARLDV